MSHNVKISLSGSGSPIGAIVPEFIGQVYRDTANNLSYTAKGLTNSDWELHINGDESAISQVWLKSDIGGANGDVEIYDMAVYNDKLYIGTGNSVVANDNTAAKIFVYDGSSWSVITKADIANSAGINPVDMNNDNFFRSFGIYNNKLYVGVSNTTAAIDTTGAKICVFDGVSWSVITKATIGAVNADTAFNFIIVYGNKLYTGTRNTTAATDVTGSKVCVFDGVSWSVITKATMGGHANDQYIYDAAIYNNKLYICTYNTTAATNNTASKLLVYDGVSWTAILKSSIFGCVNGDVLNSFAVYNGRLFVGIYNGTVAADATAAKVLTLNNTTWDYFTKTEMELSSNDIILFKMAVYNGKLYIGTYNATNALDNSACKIAAYNGTKWGRFYKGILQCSVEDDAFFSMIVYKGRLFAATYNITAGIGSTALKIVAIKSVNSLSDNSYTSRGF